MLDRLWDSISVCSTTRWKVAISVLCWTDEERKKVRVSESEALCRLAAARPGQDLWKHYLIPTADFRREPSGLQTLDLVKCVRCAQGCRLRLESHHVGEHFRTLFDSAAESSARASTSVLRGETAAVCTFTHTHAHAHSVRHDCTDLSPILCNIEIDDPSHICIYMQCEFSMWMWIACRNLEWLRKSGLRNDMLGQSSSRQSFTCST